MARQLGMKSVAEGLEAEDDWHVLCELSETQQSCLPRRKNLMEPSSRRRRNNSSKPSQSTVAPSFRMSVLRCWRTRAE
jgi:hypothetical protein